MAAIDMKELARLGAATRVTQLNDELAEIYRSFPGLRRGTSSGDSGEAAPAAPRRRRRRRMSAAQKKAVSVRMKKYWAGRRKAKTG